MTSPTVLLLGALDTKGAEYSFVRDRLAGAGIDTITIDFGVLGEPQITVDIDRAQVARAGGAEVGDLASAGDRGAAMAVMASGATEVVRELVESGRATGALALGGTGGTSVAATAFRGLPLGFPRIILSTAASGNTEQYIGETDLILIPSIVDIAGLNRISLRMLANAAAAIAGMVNAAPLTQTPTKPLVAASMFGVTTPAVTRARERLEELGYEVLIFHMTGSGGRAMEALIRQGYIDGVLDLTTTELADDLVGGVFSAGPARLTAAGETGTPQIVSPGALDMVNFGSIGTVPECFRDRNLYVHNSSVTLMRTTPEEAAQLGAELARKVAAAIGPTTVILPLGGVSAISVPGGPFHDEAADDALFSAIRNGLEGSALTIVESSMDINDPHLAIESADRLHEMISEHSAHFSTRPNGK
ncbi:Tm-1-like ATP-binding domain-containing protein [Glaciibacter superstes]|uniref:Tm-1-like ATP-binding domain-containing protein n=1 Tax=Glaciibacter superstes TaxID=501023 RepID=UPI0003B42B33|nr:Tm-1-like ATP-binding domain-containing protein [Glaciibacter superstes]